MAPRAGFEPATKRLTAACSTTELPRNSKINYIDIHTQRMAILFKKFVCNSVATANLNQNNE